MTDEPRALTVYLTRDDHARFRALRGAMTGTARRMGMPAPSNSRVIGLALATAAVEHLNPAMHEKLGLMNLFETEEARAA